MFVLGIGMSQKYLSFTLAGTVLMPFVPVTFLRATDYESSADYKKAYGSKARGPISSEPGSDGKGASVGGASSARGAGAGGTSGGGDQYIQKITGDDREVEMNENLG